MRRTRWKRPKTSSSRRSCRKCRCIRSKWPAQLVDTAGAQEIGDERRHLAKAPAVPPATSLLLDSLRVLAAGLVFVGHCAQFWNGNIRGYGHPAVIIFFVLSGYVIAASTRGRPSAADARRYAIARLSRLCSVVVPALALTAFLQLGGSALRPEFYGQFDRGHGPFRYLVTAAFAQNFWFLNASPPTNAPFWSLSYEFVYYALFGVAIFVRNRATRWAMLVLIAAMAGPNIMLLLPCWLLGAQVAKRRFAMRTQAAAGACAVSAVAATAGLLWLPHFPFTVGYAPMFFSGAFLTDWLLALSIAATIGFFDAASLHASPPAILQSAVRFAADYTFSLYLYHYPLVIAAAALIDMRRGGAWVFCSSAAGVLALVFLLGRFTESKRDRWKAWFGALLPAPA